MKKLQIINSGDLPGKGMIEEFERINKIKLPSIFVKFLVETNPIDVVEILFLKRGREYGIDCFYPFDSSNLSIQNAFKDLNFLFQSEYIAFGCDEGGWQFVISLKEDDYGKIYFCRMDMEIPEALTLLADNFEEFINGLEKPPYE